MKNNFLDRKAEDILTNDFLIEKLTKEELSENKYNNNELHIAKKIHRTFSEKRNTLEQTPKDLLGIRISQTILKYKRKKLIIRFSSAAVFFILIGVGTLFQMNKEPGIRTYAMDNQFGPVTENTRLILSGEKEIQINSTESKIEYNVNGNNIEIDTNHKIKQDAEGDEVVLNTVIVPYGKRTLITLSDNSKIWINSGSKLIYPAKFASDKREVYLDGEAIFEVSHNKNHPFYVVTRDMEVKVLGTVFNLSAYLDDNTTNTTLESGSVELKYKNNSYLSQSKVTMVPGMLAVYDPSQKKVKQIKVNTKRFTSWREGYLVFESQSLGDIVKKVSRHYNVAIRVNDHELENETFSGSLDLQNSAYKVLEIIAEIIGAEVENINNHIIITKS
ncbi:MAG: FecR domain-containing protein [Bacteroidetes bacterium]|nr:FecR domain-containing protein [Bacteroidota bacterium]